MIKKRLLVIQYDLNSSLFDYLKNFPEYIVDKVCSYEELKKTALNYDVCTININEDEERDFAVYYILQKNKSQKILQVFEESVHCFFNCKCHIEDIKIKKLFVIFPKVKR